MAQHTTVELVDDIDGGPADETIEFGFRGNLYEIDLAEDHIKELAEFLGPFIERARRIRTGPIRAGATRSIARSASRREDLNAIRAWARDNGYEVSDRGRVAQHIIDAYHQR